MVVRDRNGNYVDTVTISNPMREGSRFNNLAYRHRTGYGGYISIAAATRARNELRRQGKLRPGYRFYYDRNPFLYDNSTELYEGPHGDTSLGPIGETRRSTERGPNRNPAKQLSERKVEETGNCDWVKDPRIVEYKPERESRGCRSCTIPKICTGRVRCGDRKKGTIPAQAACKAFPAFVNVRPGGGKIPWICPNADKCVADSDFQISIPPPSLSSLPVEINPTQGRNGGTTGR